MILGGSISAAAMFRLKDTGVVVWPVISLVLTWGGGGGGGGGGLTGLRRAAHLRGIVIGPRLGFLGITLSTQA